MILKEVKVLVHMCTFHFNESAFCMLTFCRTIYLPKLFVKNKGVYFKTKFFICF